MNFRLDDNCGNKGIWERRTDEIGFDGILGGMRWVAEATTHKQFEKKFRYSLRMGAAYRHVSFAHIVHQFSNSLVILQRLL